MRSSLWVTLLKTRRDAALTLVRIALGAVMFPHGAQKLLGWYGGYGFAGTMQYFHSIGVPALLGFPVIIAESFGALALIVGLLARPAAFGIGASITGALFLVHLPYGFFMNWFGNQKVEGIEFDLLMSGMAGAVLLRGAGAFSLDQLLARLLNTAGTEREPLGGKISP